MADRVSFIIEDCAAVQADGGRVLHLSLHTLREVQPRPSSHVSELIHDSFVVRFRGEPEACREIALNISLASGGAE